MPIKFTLADIMRRYDITQKELSEVSGVRMNTIKDIRNGEAKALTVDKLDALITGINVLTNGDYGLDAVLIYEPTTEDCE